MMNSTTASNTIDTPHGTARGRARSTGRAGGSATRSRSTAAKVEARLRLVLRANAVTSAASGAVGLVAAGYWSERLGIDNVAVTAAIAVGLLVFAADVWFGSRASGDGLRRHALLVSLADLAWVAASGVVVALGILTTFGTVATVLVVAVVADFAAAQLWLRHRL